MTSLSKNLWTRFPACDPADLLCLNWRKGIDCRSLLHSASQSFYQNLCPLTEIPQKYYLSCASCIYNLNEGWETICCQGCKSRRSFFRTTEHAPIKMGRESTCHDLCSMSATLWWKYHSRTKYILWSSSGAVTAENLSFRNLKFRVKSLHMRADYMVAFQTRSFMLCFFGCVSAVDALRMDNGHASS